METKDEIFKEIYDSMYHELLWYAASHLKNKYLLEDILQETFEDIYFCLDNVINADDPRAWIYGCLKNNLNEMLRKEWKHEENCISYENDLDPLESDGRDVINEVTNREALRQELGEENYKEMSLRYFSGYTMNEIAESRNQSEVQYRMQFLRMKRKMKHRLKRHRFDEE